MTIAVISTFILSVIAVGFGPTTLATQNTEPLGDKAEVSVWGDDEKIYVKFNTTDPNWCLTETSISISNANTTSGLYTSVNTHDPCVDTYTEEIDISSLPTGIELQIMATATIINTETQETLYLTDSGQSSNNGVDTKLFEVEINETNDIAYLTQLKTLTDYDQVDALACSADGEKIYAIDKYSGHIGVYNVSDDTFTDLGKTNLPTGKPNGVVLAAFSPIDNLLYVASSGTEELYTINVAHTPLTANSIGTIEKETGGTLDIQGADLVFAADGTLYIWVNPSELYMVEDIYDQNATAKDMGSPSKDYHFTGLAILEAGTGDLVASTHSGPIYVVDPNNANVGEDYNTYLGGTGYQVGYGDMTVGELTDVRTETAYLYYTIPGETFDCEIYAGAGQNDLTKATHVGNITVNVDAQTITITLFEDFGLKEAHLYIGEDPLPTKDNPGKGKGKGKGNGASGCTVAPGQFPYKAENLEGAMTYTFTDITELNEEAYFILHIELTNGETGFAHCENPTTFTEATDGDIKRWGWTNLVSDNLDLD